MNLFSYFNAIYLAEGDVVSLDSFRKTPERLITRHEYDKVSNMINDKWHEKSGDYMDPIDLHQVTRDWFNQRGYTGYDPETMDVEIWARRDKQTKADSSKPLIPERAFFDMVEDIKDRYPDMSNKEAMSKALDAYHELGYQYGFEEEDEDMDRHFKSTQAALHNVIAFPKR